MSGAFVEAFNHLEHEEEMVSAQRSRGTEDDPYSLDDAFSGGVSVNIGSSSGIGPKVYDVFGTPKIGFSTSCCGAGPGFGTDTVFGGPYLAPSIGVSAPYQLASIGVGGAYYNGQLGGS